MRVTTPGRNLGLGRHVFGAAAVAAGLVTLAWHEYNDWNQPRYLVYAAGGAQIVGGVAIQFGRAAKMGAGVLCAVYLVFALLCVPRIAAAPQIYNSWGNFFEQLSLVTGAAMVYARRTPTWSWEMVTRTGRMLLGICVASFTLEQANYVGATASLVPKWIPPGPMFWAVATTVSFALAAVALLTNQKALLATRLLTLMLAMFLLLVWVPLVVADPRSHTNWSESVETFTIAGVAWIVVDLFSENRLSVR